LTKKKKTVKPQREPTKRQLSRWQQQKRRQRIILSAGIVTIAAVLVLVLLGWYFGQYKPLHQTVIRVNSTEFDMKYYIDMLKLRGEGQSIEYMYLLADDTVKEIERIELIRQGASELGVNVSEEEVKEGLESSGLPAKDAARDLVRSRILLEKLQNEYFALQIPTSIEQAHILAMLLESEKQAVEVRTRLENSESFAELAGELSLEYFTKTNEGDLGFHPESIFTDLLGTSIPIEYAFGAEVGKLSQPIYDEELVKNTGYWLTKVLERGEEEEEEAHVHAMLLGNETEAQDIRARLEAGDNFTALAKEFSQLSGAVTNEGDLGIVFKGEITTAFDEFVFNLDIEPGTLSEPIRDETIATKGGYWLVKALDKDDDRQLEDSDRNLLKAKALEEWGSSLLDDPSIEIDDSYLDDEKKEWAIEQVIKAISTQGG